MHFIPKYQFGIPVGPCHHWFAWYPVKLFYGKWVWFEKIARQKIVKKPYLDGPDWEFWCYADVDAVNERTLK